MSDPTFEIEGRKTGRGAFTDAEVVQPNGHLRQADRTETSRIGNHWTSSWLNVSDCLILVTDISNSGKDHSYVQQEPDAPTPEQEKALDKFKVDHWLG